MNTPARNCLCPCGSGKKYKRCCLIKASNTNDAAVQAGESRSYGVNATNVAPPSSILMKGVAFHQAGRLNEAEAVYQSLLKANPNDSDALHYLGLISYQRQRYPDAIKLFEAAIRINSTVPAFYCNLGNAYKALGQFDSAIAAYREALRLDPRFQAAYCNLGGALKSRGDLEEAVASCRRALEITPDFAEAHNNLGTALHGLGRPNEAAASYRNAIQIRPDYAEALLNLGHACCMSDNLAEAAASYRKALEIDPANDGLEAAVYLSILSYLDGNLEQCKSMLGASRPVLAMTGTRRKNSAVYWHYLDRLLSVNRQPDNESPQAKEIGVLYVVGESHCLSAHGVKVRYRGQDMRCSAQWITGCKQWHLGNDKPNIYKYKFDRVMARLPPNSAVLLLVGEIDCRQDEGIVTAWKKHPDRSLDEVIQVTVEKCLKYVAATGERYGHRIIVGGVPATNTPLNDLAKTEAERHVEIIRSFNANLKRQALASGADFLDIYALTDRGDGIASGEWHIDNFHLQPCAIAEAFDRHVSTIGKNENAFVTAG